MWYIQMKIVAIKHKDNNKEMLKIINEENKQEKWLYYREHAIVAVEDENCTC